MGYVIGALSANLSMYQQQYERDSRLVREVLAEDGDCFADLEMERTSTGEVMLVGTVANEDDYRLLEQEMIRLLGERDAEIAVRLVEVITESSTRPAARMPMSMDDVLAQIIRTDWQTAGQWELMTDAPPKEFVENVREKARLQEVDLDGIGEPEVVLGLNWSPGQKGNQTSYVLRRKDDGWCIIGELEGQPTVHHGAEEVSGMKVLNARWYNGGHAYTVTTYEFHDGRYEAASSEAWRPTETR